MSLKKLFVTVVSLTWFGSAMAQALSFTLSEPWGKPWDDELIPLNGSAKAIKHYVSWADQDGKLSKPALEYQFDFDKQGQLTQVTQAWGGREPPRITEYSYVSGRRTQERRIKPDQETVSQKFDGSGCLVEWRHDSPSQPTFARRYRCEQRNSITRRTEAAIPTVWSEFDAQGRVSSMVTDGTLVIRSDGQKRPEVKRFEYGLTDGGEYAMITRYGLDAGKEAISGREFRDLKTGALLSEFAHSGVGCCLHFSYKYLDIDPANNWLSREKYQKIGEKWILKAVATRTIDYWR